MKILGCGENTEVHNMYCHFLVPVPYPPRNNPARDTERLEGLAWALKVISGTVNIIKKSAKNDVFRKFVRENCPRYLFLYGRLPVAYN